MLSSKRVATVAQERCLFLRGSNRNDLIVNFFLFLFGGRCIGVSHLQEVFAAHSGFTVGFSCGESVT